MKTNLNNIDISVMKSIPKEMAIKMKIISLRKHNENLCFYTNKKNEDKKTYLSLIFNKEIEFIEGGDEEEINKLINICYGDEIYNINNENYTEIQFKNLINNAIENNASDIHLEPQEKWTNIRYRIDGILNLKKQIQKKEYINLNNKIKLEGGMDISDKYNAQDGKITFANLNNKDLDLRISSIPTIHGEKIVIRILYKNQEFIDIDKLNFNNTQREKINKILKLKHGMVLVNGPTGSGKSTTLYTLINSVNKEEVNISTIEDPVEFYIEGVSQSNVNDKIGLSFSQGLKHILRQDPDIILIGEIRDEETAKMAIRASVTGHKVYSTIHTNNGYEVYGRLIDMGAKEYLIRDVLKGIITQRLVRTLCEYCKKEQALSEDECVIFNLPKDSRVFRNIGCKLCEYSGYRGRTMICEVIFGEELNIGHKINNKFGEELLESCFNLVRKGSTSLEEYILFKESEGFYD